MKLLLGVVTLAIIISTTISADDTRMKPLKMARGGGNAVESKTKTVPKEMGKEEAEKRKADKEKVKKLLAEYNQKMKTEQDKRAKQQQQDEKLNQVLKEIKGANAKHPEEKRKPAKSIGKMNANIGRDELFEGDMELNVEQAQFLVDNSEQSNGTESSTSIRASRVKRGGAINAQTFPSNKWPTYVPYSFDSTISPELKNNIYAGVQMWYDNTCLYLKEDASASPRLQFTNVAGGGCRSSLGKQSSSTYQNVYIESPGCELAGTVAHEIGHALGFYHEQSRYDRDSFVWYNSANVKPNKTGNFNLQSAQTNDNYQITYDLGSNMHYGAKDFAIPGTYTLVPKAGAQYVNTIGQGFGPSFSDYLVMNKHYCGLNLYSDGSSQNNVTCSAKTTCANAGFQNPNTCTDCICPEGYTGAQCQNIDTVGYAPTGTTNTCNGTTIQASSNWQDLYGKIGSSALDSSTEYAQCHWQIVADVGKTISIQVVDVGNVCADSCVWGNTEIRTDANRGASGLRLCCLSDLGSTGQLQISAPNGYALISLYSLYNVQQFHIRFMQS